MSADGHWMVWKYPTESDNSVHAARGEYQLLLAGIEIAFEVTIILVVQQSISVSNECSSFHSSGEASCCACESALNL